MTNHWHGCTMNKAEDGTWSVSVFAQDGSWLARSSGLTELPAAIECLIWWVSEGEQTPNPQGAPATTETELPTPPHDETETESCNRDQAPNTQPEAHTERPSAVRASKAQRKAKTAPERQHRQAA